MHFSNELEQPVFNLFSVNSAFNMARIEQFQRQQQKVDSNVIYEEIVKWKYNYFAATQNINESRGPKYKCCECTSIFNTRLSLFTHSKSHLKPFCILCGKYSQTKTEMYQHMKNIHRNYVICKTIKVEQLNYSDNLSSFNEINQNQKNIKAEPLTPKSNRKVGRPRKESKHLNDECLTNDEKVRKTKTSRSGRCITMKIFN